MSLFRTIEVPCPSCNVPVSFDLVHSVNADRRADLRAAILNRTFQQEKCPSCGFAFRTEPEFTYINLGRNQWIAVWPASKRARWSECERHSQQAYDKGFGQAAPPEAQELAKEVRPRVVFGWAALCEKLIAHDAGIDDVTLELAKLAVARNQDDSPLAGNVELRLLGVEGDHLVLGWLQVGSEELTEVVRVSSDLIKEVEAQAADWKELRDELTSGIFVDMQKLMIPAAA